MRSPLEKIISGGQTGADIAAVDAAIACGFPYGGELPKGRRREGGRVPTGYLEFTVSVAYDYRVRTKTNVLRADGTLVFSKGKPKTGTAETVSLAKKNGKPCMVINTLDSTGMIPTSVLIHNFVKEHNIKVLNVAGPRESKTPGIYDVVFKTITQLLEQVLFSCKVYDKSV